MGEQPLLTVSVPGIPSSYSTPKEKPWKEALNTHIPLAPLLGSVATGVVANFRVPRPQVGHRKVDLDNLCEPLFSVLVNQKHWFGKTRPNIQWFKVTKSYEEPFGCDVCLFETLPRNEALLEQKVLFSATYDSAFPKSAQDIPFADWVKLYHTSTERSEWFSICIQFGFNGNIGDIASEATKSIIDCLYPILGGKVGAPQDWRVIELQVEKNVSDIPVGAVRVLVSAL